MFLYYLNANVGSESDEVRNGDDRYCEKEDGNCKESEAEKAKKNNEDRTTGETGQRLETLRSQ